MVKNVTFVTRLNNLRNHCEFLLYFVALGHRPLVRVCCATETEGETETSTRKKGAEASS